MLTPIAAACPARRRAIFTAIALAIVTPPLTAAETSSANTEQTVAFAIPAKPLDEAINDFITVSDWQVGFPAALAQGVRSSGVSGRYTPTQALQKLLADTGISARVTANRTVKLAQNTAAPNQPRTAMSTTEAAVLPTVTVTGKTEDADDPRNASYTVTHANTATKTDALVLETPVSIQVVPKSVLNDQKSVTIKDALENVSSVRPQPSIGIFNGFIVRGFPDFNQYRNGLRVTYTDFDTANLERLEVLKGPSAILFGRVEPGGLINLVTKKPQATPYYSLEQQFGSFDFYRTLYDATGPIMGNGDLQYRLTGDYQNSGSFREYHQTEQFQIHAALNWRVSDATDIAVDVEGFNKDFQSDQGLPAIGVRPAPIPIRRSLQDPNDPTDHLSNINMGFNLTHKFTEDWVLRNRFLAQLGRWDLFDSVVAYFDASALRPDNRTLDRTLFYQAADRQTYATNLDLTGNFELAGTRHKTLIGFDYLRQNETYTAFGDFANADPSLAIDIFNPTARINPARFDLNTIRKGVGTFVGSYQKAAEEWYGVYFQDQITLWDKLHILGGGRYDWASTGRGRSAISYLDAEANRQPQHDQAFSPRVGILYQPWSWFSVYGNWAQSFGANNSSPGQTFKPQTGEQFEAGIKTAFFEERLTTTLAYYHITKDNLPTPNLATSDPFDSILVGQARSQGIELGLSGQINEYFSLIGNYAYTDAKYTKDNSGLQDKILAGVPDHSGSLWLKYDHQGIDAREGLSLGIGVFAAGQRQGDAANSFQLPGYVRLDASAAYRWKLAGSVLTTQLNIRNLLDKAYYESTDPFSNAPPRLGIFPGAPLTVMGSLRLEY